MAEPATAWIALMIVVGLAAPAAFAKQAPVETGRVLATFPAGLSSGVHPLTREGATWMSGITGYVQTAFQLDTPPCEGGPETAARAFLEQWGPRLGLQHGLSDLRTVQVQNAPGGWHVRFQQTSNGVDVWHGDLVVSLDAAGRCVRAVQSNYDPILAASGWMAATVVDAAGARAIAAAALGLPHDPNDPLGLRAALTDEPRADLWVVREGDLPGGTAHLAFRVYLPAQDPAGDWMVSVDAENGRVLDVRDGRVFVDGAGLTFDPDPLTTAEMSYGGQYADNSDGDTPELNAERVPHVLPQITYSGGLYRLEGPFVRIVNFENPPDPPATEENPDGFTYTRHEQGFEDAHVYYHIDNSQRHIQALGFLTIQNGSIQIDTHGLNGDDNSYYSPGSNRIAYGEGGVDDAEDADVVLHEYGHAIQYSINPGWGGGHEGAMGEGFGDYWAGSHSASISSYREEWVFNWDGHNPFWGGRVLNSTMHYPEDLNGQVHHDGQIWSAPLFQSWHEIGRQVMDQIVLKGHFYLGSSATMAQGAAAIMQADLDLQDGLHAGTLDYYFTARGFFAPGDYDVPEVEHDPLPDTEELGPYLVTCQVATQSLMAPGGVRVVYGVGGVFDQETTLTQTFPPGTFQGWMASQGSDVEITYYIKAKNRSGWQGTSPRGAEYTHHSFMVTGASGADEITTDRLSLSVPSNPALGGSALRLVLPASGSADLTIFDASGRRIRTLWRGGLSAGLHTLVWDGRNDIGLPAGAGSYWVRLTSEGGVLVRGVVLER